MFKCTWNEAGIIHTDPKKKGPPPLFLKPLKWPSALINICFLSIKNIQLWHYNLKTIFNQLHYPSGWGNKMRISRTDIFSTSRHYFVFLVHKITVLDTKKHLKQKWWQNLGYKYDKGTEVWKLIQREILYKQQISNGFYLHARDNISEKFMCFDWRCHRLNEQPHDKTNKMICPLSKNSPSLIRVFAVRMKKPWFLSYPLSTQRRLWSDWVQSFCWFCHEGLKCWK